MLYCDLNNSLNHLLGHSEINKTELMKHVTTWSTRLKSILLKERIDDDSIEDNDEF